MMNALQPTENFTVISNTAMEHNIVAAQNRVIIFDQARIEEHANNAEAIADAFRGDRFVFETEKAQQDFWKKAHPKDACRISYSCIGILEYSKDGTHDHLITGADYIVCLGPVQTKIENDIRGMKAQSSFSQIDYDAVIRKIIQMRHEKHGRTNMPKRTPR